MISILIPTLNRPEFLYRALKYYKAAGFDGVISIGDSSSSENSTMNLFYIDKLKGSLDIDYRYYEKDKYDIGLVLKDQIERVRTPYIAVCCDDDFLNVSGVKKCVSFLEANTTYISARGMRLNFMLSKIDDVYGEIDKVHYVPSLNLEDDRASDRWATYMNCNTATAYNVHRKETFQKMWQHIEDLITYDLKYELYPCSVTCLLGKTKNIDVLYNIVQQHHGSLSYSGKITIYDAIMNEGWSTSVKNFSNYICEELKVMDKLTDQEAQSFVYKEFEKYLVSHFLNQTKTDNNNIDKIMNIGLKLKNYIKGRPNLYSFLIYLRSRKIKPSNMFNNPKDGPVSLSAMMSPSSPYREDFMAIANVISKKDQ
ncbi:MAG: TIGR00180 family glycosyltransferase [Smithellaceae bacterium]